jgi:predicted lipid-binding transport protein (Tim44 family)
MKHWLIGALVVAVVATVAPSTADAKRVGGGKSTGMQRDMPARTAPDAAPGKPAAAPAAAAATPAAGAAAAPAAAPKRNWMGPLAGLAAGLGIAALMSHLGMGEAFGNFLMMALLAVAAIFLVRFLMNRFGGGSAKNGAPALAGAGAGMGGAARANPAAWPSATHTERTALDTPVAAGSSGASAGPAEAVAEAVAPAAPAVAKVFVPASFDSEAFTRTAKMIFIRLQASNDTADLDDLRRFTTPELFASIRLDIQDRGTATQHTDVQEVHAHVLDVATEGADQVVSVRFTGKLVEEKGAAAIDFNEVWHLVKPLDDSKSWAIAGIEQMDGKGAAPQVH